MRASRAVGATVLLAVLVGGCGGGGSEAGSSAAGELDGTLRVLAATSLAEAFEDVERAFEAVHPGVDVQVTADGSANLATAIIEGVPADVFASADDATLARVADAGLVEGDPDGTAFATNVLQIVVAAGNPLVIDSLADLAGGDVTLSLCQVEVPCGRYAVEAFEAAGLEVPPAGQEDKVSGVLTKVVLGEADAGLVYVTDVLAADGVEGVDLAEGERPVATYPAAVLSDAPNPEVAATFVEFLTSDEAQGILEAFGFGPP